MEDGKAGKDPPGSTDRLLQANLTIVSGKKDTAKTGN